MAEPSRGALRLYLIADTGLVAPARLPDAVRAALSYQSGTIVGVVVLSVLPDVQGPDLYDDVLLVPYQSRDFLIKHYQ